jgi:hypothetical protein
MDVRLRGTFTVRSPLSHIGESISTVAYLVQEPILQEDGRVEEVFVYAGNAWRGQLRDLAAEYLLEGLGAPTLPLPAFHLLFAGGAIGGEQSTNIEQARQLRRALPIIALFGGGIGNQILPGKLRVRQCYPACREALRVLPPALHEHARGVSYKSLTFSKQYTRRDDAKDARYEGHLLAPSRPAQAALLPSEEGSQSRRGAREEPPQQMRYELELLAPGAVLSTGIDVLDCTEVELGCLVSALHRFARSPHIGGKAATGHGLVDLRYDYTLDGEGGAEPFMAVEEGAPELSPLAAEAKRAYDAYVLEQYQAYIDSHGAEMMLLLGGRV